MYETEVLKEVTCWNKICNSPILIIVQNTTLYIYLRDLGVNYL